MVLQFTELKDYLAYLKTIGAESTNLGMSVEQGTPSGKEISITPVTFLAEAIAPPPPRCGRTTRKGTCRMKLSHAGKCPIHDLTDLSARNRKVARAFKKNNPAAIIAQRVVAGHNGFIATGGAKGWERANEFARQWRLQHPSEPERWAMSVLDAAGYIYEREFPVDGGSAIDFAFPDSHVAVEINGHQDKPAFGEIESRQEKHNRKCATLRAQAWSVLVVNPNGDRAREAEVMLKFLSDLPLRHTDAGWDEIPF